MEYVNGNFSAHKYAKGRPTYPDNFIRDVVLKVHLDTGGQEELHVDLGCGTGQATFKLCKFFAKSIGTDPSLAMIQKCNEKNEAGDRVEFRQISAEQIAELPELGHKQKVDLFTAAECIHWMDHATMFKQVHEVLKPSGTFVYWMYGDPVVTKRVTHPEKPFNKSKFIELYDKYTYNDPEFMGPLWEQPGRSFLKNLLKGIDPPKDLFKIVKSEKFNPRLESKNETGLNIELEWTVNEFMDYVDSWSAYNKYSRLHGDNNTLLRDYKKELIAQLDIEESEVMTFTWGVAYFALKPVH